jgi:N-hydroxyarylamine O-acetyltransferase
VSADVDRYLSRLGFSARPAPTVAGLAELHRRHLDAVPYDNLAIMLGRPDPHLTHLVLLVTIDGRRWWPDLGLGDGLREPVEVVGGEIRQGPFRYELTDVAGDEWTFRHDPSGSFEALDIRAPRPADADVTAAHQVLSGPGGRFTRVFVAQRRDDAGAETVRGIRHQRTGAGAFTRDLRDYDEWRAAVESLGVSLAGVTDGELRALHAHMAAAHADWSHPADLA